MQKQKGMILLIVVFGLFFATNVFAQQSNVYGWAWAENIGWISFSAYNCDSNNDGVSDGSPLGCPPAGTPIPSYGVNLDPDTGLLSGYAWAETIGWISFESESLQGCPLSPCEATVDTDCPGDQCSLSGWARACSVFQSNCSGSLKSNTERGGWDGWIRLHNSLYGVWVDPDTSHFHHYAWGGNDTNGDWNRKAVIGWISFNCAEGGSSQNNICSISDYKVLTGAKINRPPEARNLSVSETDYCCAGSPPVQLSWEFYDPDAGDYQTAYRVQIDTNSDFSSPEVDTGKVSSSSEQYVPLNLSFETTYYWRVMVWDSADKSSFWTIGPSFTTDSHHPCPDFTWTPERPAVDQIVQFTDLSTPDGGGIQSWSWRFEFGNPSTSSEQNPQTKFTQIDSDGNQVRLRIQDLNGNICSITKHVNVRLPLPKWKEIQPF